ncbi:MAG: DUF4352 domain-containing protein [Tissierellia bacterium]|nr:DUF4352 domain-containing protein [Tissierellia bacterium]
MYRNRKKVFLITLLFVIMSLILVACGSESTDADVSDEEISDGGEGNETLTFGDTFEFDGFEIEMGSDYSFDVVDNEFSDHDGESVAVVPVTVTNKSGETNSFNMFFYTIFNSSGTEAESIMAYFDNSLEFMGDLRDGATGEANIYILYDGDGDYYLEFDNFSEEVEVKLPIEKKE